MPSTQRAFSPHSAQKKSKGTTGIILRSTQAELSVMIPAEAESGHLYVPGFFTSVTASFWPEIKAGFQGKMPGPI